MADDQDAPPSEAAPTSPKGNRPDLTLLARVLDSHVKALAGATLFSVASAVILAVLGHPLLALGMATACVALDLGLHRLYQRWRAAVDTRPPLATMRRLGFAVLARGGAAVGAPIIAVLISGRPADLVYLGLISAGTLLVTVTQSILSPYIFTYGVAAPGLGLAVLVASVTERPTDVVLWGGLAILIAMAGLIARLAGRSNSALLRRQNETTRLVDHLTTAIDQALMQAEAAEQAREEAREASLAKSTFLATMSHEIRTPMNGVLGMAQMLQRSEMTPLQRQQVDTIIKSGEFLMSILNDVLDLSKIDAGRMEIHKAPCDLRALIAEMEAFWGPNASDRGLALSVDVAPGVPDHAALDPRRVRQILFNLAGNALKFTEEGGISVTLTCEQGDTLAFAVSDTGVGIAEADVPRLFEMFRQVDASDIRRFAGTGMGLAICQQLSDLMGGSISVESAVGRGSTFILRLPFEACAAPAASRPEPDAHDGEAAALSILAADDNPTNLLVLEQLLGALGFEISKAGGGPEALEMLRTQSFDLVLMDIQMPEMTGIDVLQAVRAEPGPNLASPFIAVTADAMTLGPARYAELGFSGFVTKPIQAQSLVSAMMAAMAEDEAPATPAAIAG